MDDTKIKEVSKEEILKLSITPVNKHFILEPVLVDTGSKIIRPDSTGEDSMRPMLRITHIAGDCTKVEIGDYVLLNSDAVMGKFAIVDDEFVMADEDGLGAILRPKK